MKSIFSSGLLLLLVGSKLVFTYGTEMKRHLRKGSTTRIDERKLAHHSGGSFPFPPRPTHGSVPIPAPGYGQSYDNNPPAPGYGQSYDNNPPAPDYGQSYDNNPPAPDHGQNYDNNPPAPDYGQSYDNNHPAPDYGQSYDNNHPAPDYGQSHDNNPPAPDYGQSHDNNPYPKYPQPYPNPTDRPTPVPTPRPTDRPTPIPTRMPSPRPSAAPSTKPSTEPSPAPSGMPSKTPTSFPSRSPSEQPTNSLEPSENPTQSEEPSENPTQSEEPSENPTNSVEPSERPSISQEPSATTSAPTIAGFICAQENAAIFSTLCTVIEASPAVYLILNNNFPFIQFRNGETLGIPPRIASKHGERNLMSYSKYTMFAPDNDAFERFLGTPLNELFEGKSRPPEAVSYFNSIGINIAVDTTPARNFFLGANGSSFLNRLLLSHILGGERRSDRLDCSESYRMLSGEDTVTKCVQAGDVVVSKAQVGSGNTLRNLPTIVDADKAVSNGIVHNVTGVIVPEFLFPSSKIKLPEGFFGLPEVYEP